MLQERGIAQGNRILIVLPRIPEWQIVMNACPKLGAVAIPCVTMLPTHDLEYRITHSGACAVVMTTELTDKFGGISDVKRIVVGE